MTKWLSILLHFFLALFRTRRDLAFENLLLRQQLAILKEKGARPQLSASDRSFWVLASKLWPRWRDALHLVRPVIDPKIREMIKRMSQANPLWGAPRIHGELLKLGIKERIIQFPDQGDIRSRQHCGGLHHEYFRRAA